MSLLSVDKFNASLLNKTINLCKNNLGSEVSIAGKTSVRCISDSLHRFHQASELGK